MIDEPDKSWQEFYDTYIANPCEKMQKVGKNTVTKNAMKNLKTKVNDNKEHINVLWEDSNGNLKDDIYFEGPVNGDGADLQFSPGDKFSAYLHSHYNKPGMLSTFSFEDFMTLCSIIHFDAMKDKNSFVMGVVTPQGTQYMFIVDNIAKFQEFASQFYINGIYNEDLADIYKGHYLNSIKHTNTIEKNEKSLVNFLDVTGVKLMKGDNQMENWQQLNKNNDGTITPVNCN